MKTLTPIQSAIIDSLSNQFAPLPKTSSAELALLEQFFQGDDLTDEIKTFASLVKTGVRILPTNRKAISRWLLGRIGFYVADSERRDDVISEAMERAVVNMIDADHKKDDWEGWRYVSVVKAQAKRRKSLCHNGKFCDDIFDSVVSGLISSGAAETDASGKKMRMTGATRK